MLCPEEVGLNSVKQSFDPGYDLRNLIIPNHVSSRTIYLLICNSLHVGMSCMHRGRASATMSRFEAKIYLLLLKKKIIALEGQPTKA